MKRFLIILSLLSVGFAVLGQTDSTATDSTTVRIIKTDGGTLLGTIISQDAREVFFRTNDGREIYIPQYVIERIETIGSGDLTAKGKFIGEDAFSTRYFITTNGLPIKKGEHYVQWNLFGPDFQFGVSKNLGAGIMTSWVGSPLIASIKQSFSINENTQVALGLLAGTGSWVSAEVGGVLPFATLSVGNRQRNLALSGGYCQAWITGESWGRPMAGVGGMIKVSPKISLVFDSFILLRMKPEEYTDTYDDYVYNPETMEYEWVTVTVTGTDERRGFALLIPGIRWHSEPGKAFQFGLSGIIAEGEAVPVPIPMVQWYRNL